MWLVVGFRSGFETAYWSHWLSSYTCSFEGSRSWNASKDLHFGLKSVRCVAPGAESHLLRKDSSIISSYFDGDLRRTLSSSVVMFQIRRT